MDTPDKLIAAGHVGPAVQQLETRGRRGDGAALLKLATMRLAGDLIPRDLSAARSLLTEARSVGNLDAALMEAALTANGTGAPPDWPGAVMLLRNAARSDDLAAEHLTMLDAMDLDGYGFPKVALRVETRFPDSNIMLAPAFISPAEARHIVQAVADILEPSRVYDPTSGRMIAHPIRTSRSAAIGPTRESLPIQAILRRIARLSGTRLAQGEPLTVLDYRPGQQYRTHLDTISGAENQRIKTVLLYLNQGYQGGETRFTQQDRTIAGRGGDALLFDNVLTDGTPDPASEHAGLPVLSGQKLLATRWIRAAPIDPWTMGGGV